MGAVANLKNNDIQVIVGMCLAHTLFNEMLQSCTKNKILFEPCVVYITRIYVYFDIQYGISKLSLLEQVEC